MKRKWIIVLAAVVAVLIIVGIVIPSLINANKYRPETESKISAAVSCQVAFSLSTLGKPMRSLQRKVPQPGLQVR